MQYSCVYLNNNSEARPDKWKYKHSKWNDKEIKEFIFIMHAPVSKKKYKYKYKIYILKLHRKITVLT